MSMQARTYNTSNNYTWNAVIESREMLSLESGNIVRGNIMCGLRAWIQTAWIWIQAERLGTWVSLGKALYFFVSIFLTSEIKLLWRVLN